MTSLDRRDFLLGSSATLTAGALGTALGAETSAAQTAATPAAEDGDLWQQVRAEFALSPDLIHMSAMLIAAHPRPVREAIEMYRAELDANPVDFLESNNQRLQNDVLEAAGRYLGINRSEVALTDSTTMGVGLIYNGLRLPPGAEILTTEQDYYVTHEATRLAAERTGATVVKVPLYDAIEEVTAEAVVERVLGGVTESTRVIALTWVHSSTGLKLPLRPIADALTEINDGRDEADRILFCVDGVHGFGCEDFVLSDLGCDLFAAGCHKWLFGPRGTGIVAGTPRGWRASLPTIPSFLEDEVFNAWLWDRAPEGPTNGPRFTPGGFKPFEHVWALHAAFDFADRIGKAEIAERTHTLAGQLKEGLAAIAGVRLVTPMSSDLSAGIVSFDIDGLRPAETVGRLRERGIVASVSPYVDSHARLTPSIRNTPEEIETVLAEIGAISGRA